MDLTTLPSSKSFVTRVSYSFINVLFYLSCGLCFSFAVILILAPYTDFEIPKSFSVATTIDLHEISENDLEKLSYISLKETKGSISIEYILENHPPTYLGIGLSTVLLFAIFIYGLYQLKMLLKSVLSSDIFTDVNTQRIRLIGFLFLIFDPLRYLINIILVNPLFGDFKKDLLEFSLQVPFESSVIAGLLILVLAEIFVKAHQLYEEQKLTV